VKAQRFETEMLCQRLLYGYVKGWTGMAARMGNLSML
jgi:hypothetical protein